MTQCHDFPRFPTLPGDADLAAARLLRKLISIPRDDSPVASNRDNAKARNWDGST